MNKIHQERTMKNLILILPMALLLCFTVGCQDKAAMAEFEEFRAQAAVEEQYKASFRYMMEETDKGNYSSWDEVCPEDYVSHWGGISWNLEEHKQANRPLSMAFPDLNHEINNMIAEGDRVVMRVTLTGTHEGEYMGIPPTGNKIKYTAMLEGRFSEGKLVELWGVGELLTLMQQLGMELKPKEGEK
jgi:predicted ester cyclase